MFNTESQKLEDLINNVATKSVLPIPEIVETYYQIMNVSSMIAMIKQLGDQHEGLLSEITETEKIISNKFDTQIHPQIVSYLTKSIQDITANLQSSPGQKSKEEIENQAKLFDELREKMSTKEFVIQYEKGIKNDT